MTDMAQDGSADEKVATIEELAAVEFEPVDLWARFRLSDWFDEWGEIGAVIRLAAARMGKTKPELIEAVASLLGKAAGEETQKDWIEDLQTAQQRLRDFVELLQATEIRFMVASAAFCLRGETAA